VSVAVPEAPPRERRAAVRREPPHALLAVALAAAAALVLALTAGNTFFQDTWAFLLDRRDFSAYSFLMPHNEHIVLVPVAIQKALVAVFGTATAEPEQVVMTLLLLVTAALLFLYVRRRIGAWPALLAAVRLLILGPAWPVVLWPFEIGFVGTAAAGIALLLMLDREDARGDRWACLLLALSLGFSSGGLAFAAAAAVDVLQQRRARGLRRAYLLLVPLALFGLWYVTWGYRAEHHVLLANVLMSGPYLAEGFASSVGALFGVSTMDLTNHGEPTWGRPLLVALVFLFLYGQWRRPGVPARVWPVAAAAAAYWVLAAWNFVPGREAASSRYMYLGAAFVLLIAAELLRGVRIGRRALLVAGVVACAAVAANTVRMIEGAGWLREQTVLTRSALGAVEIADRTVDPGLVLGPEIARTTSLAIVGAGSYLEMARAHGSPAYSEEELASAPEYGRRQADVVLAAALPVRSTVAAGGSAPPGRCTRLAAAGGEAELAPGRSVVELGPGPPARLALRRFAAGEFPVRLKRLPGGSSLTISIPRDRSARPWHVRVLATQPSQICTPR
jgi:hypothetical protein